MRISELHHTGCGFQWLEILRRVHLPSAPSTTVADPQCAALHRSNHGKFNDREPFTTERGLRGLVSSHGSTYGWGLVGCGCGVKGTYYLGLYSFVYEVANMLGWGEVVM